MIVAGSIAVYYQFSDWLQVARVGVVIAGVLVAAAISATTESGRAAWAFAKGANVERQKVVWPSRREALQVTGLVILMVIVFGLYLWLLDSLSFFGIYDLVLGVRSN